MSKACSCSAEKPLKKKQAPCCGPSADIKTDYTDVTGAASLHGGKAVVVPSKWSAADYAGMLMVRFGMNRMKYAVKPGLYAVGSPGKNSHVFVSANYKLSFDILRRELSGLDAWILVLDTKSVNVWCAAGKGTFGTGQIITQVKKAKLQRVVTHRNLIVPQLGAPGTAAHEVSKGCGFRVVYGPVEASDIKPFLDSGMKADEKQRTVAFGAAKRLEVAGIEFMTAAQYSLGVVAAAVLAASFTPAGFSLAAGWNNALYFTAAFLLAVLSATVIPAALLPYLPGRMFSVKGAVSGFVVSVLYVFLAKGMTPLSQVSTVLLTSAFSSFIFMNYTGTSTFTSLTGVKKEIAVSVPVITGAALIGLALQVGDFIIKGGVRWN